MRQAFFSGTLATIPNGTRYAFVNGNANAALSTSESSRTMEIGMDGTITGLHVSLSSPPSTGTVTFTIYLDNSASGVSLTISGSDSEASLDTFLQNVTATTLWSMEIATSGVTVFGIPRWTVVVDDEDERRAVFIGGHFNTLGNVTAYPPLWGGHQAVGSNTGETRFQVPVPQDITLDYFRWRCYSGGSGATWTATVRINEVDSALSCNFASNGTPPLSCSDSGTVNVGRKDLITYSAVTSDGTGTDAPAYCSTVLRYRSKYGRFIIVGNMTGNMTNNATRYFYASGALGLYSGSDSFRIQAFNGGYAPHYPLGLRITDLVTRYASVLIDAQNFTATLLVTGSDTALQTIHNQFSSQTEHDSDVVDVGLGDYLATRTIPSGTPPSSVLNHAYLVSLSQRRQY